MLLKEVLLFVSGVIIGIFNHLTYFHNPFSDHEESKIVTSATQDFYDEKLADEMFSKVKVLCLVITHPENHKTKALSVKRTWGKRCNKILFMSSSHDSVLQTVVLPINDTREFLWGKTKKSFQYAYDHHFNDADWFLKADDDSLVNAMSSNLQTRLNFGFSFSYMFMENVRHMLYQYRAHTSLYFGHRYAVKSFHSGYMAGRRKTTIHLAHHLNAFL